jgi:SAM-dependent methyltransferase/TusA-related sulfurtransferase
MVYVASGKRDLIFEAVRAMYTDVARHPDRSYHFPTGAAACEFVGYPPERIDRLPASAVESFAGVGYPFAANVIRQGDTVLDIGSGSGTDVLIATHGVGRGGNVIALDMTDAMLAKLRANLAAAGADNVQPLEGNAERLPLPDASVDVVTSNGVLNLVPDKAAAFAEMYRVLEPGGRVQIADIALGRPITGECASNPQMWAECVVGATLEDEYVRLLRSAGFDRIEILGQLDYFSASVSAETRAIAQSFGACSIVLRAVKSPAATLPTADPWPPARAAAAAAPPSSMPLPQPDAVVEGYGQTCGTIEPLMGTRMRALQSGQVLEVRVDDPTGLLAVPAWCRLAGHALLATHDEGGGRTRFFLRRK